MVAIVWEREDFADEIFAAPQTFDQVLDRLEYSHKTTEYNCFVEGWINQRPFFKAAPQTDHVANHDDLGQHQCFDHRDPVIRVSDVVGGENKPSILRERREYERQINDIDPIFDDFMA